MKLVVKIQFFLSVLALPVFGQKAAIGQFVDHLPYSSANAICVAGDKIYVGTGPALFIYDTQDGSFTTLSKVNKLSDLGVTALAYSEEYRSVIIGYESGNIDVILNNQVINVPDIARATIQGFKSINNILVKENFAYLSTGFGIVKFDIQRNEIKETYFIGNNATNVPVNGMAFFNDTVYAATKEGVYLADANVANLADFQNWSKHSQFSSGNFNAIDASNTHLLVNLSTNNFNADTIYKYNGIEWSSESFSSYSNEDVNDIRFIDNEWLISQSGSAFIVAGDLSSDNKIFDYGAGFQAPQPRGIAKGTNGVYWIADDRQGLISSINSSTYQSFVPEGPASSEAWAMDYFDGKLWVASGALTPSLGNNYLREGLYKYENNTWTSYNSGGIDSLFDLTAVAINRGNSNEVFVGSYGLGLGRIQNGELKEVFDEYNSGIQAISVFPWRGIGGIAFDNNNVMWVSCTGLPGAPVANPIVAWDGQSWNKFNLDNKLISQTRAGELLIDDNGYKWLVSRGNGIFVFDDNGTLADDGDDRLATITTGENSGNLPTKTVNCMALDKDGAAWIGTEDGLTVISSTIGVFDNQLKADRIIIEQEGAFQFLLETEIITSIKVDGGNRKWIGTLSGGVFLVSDDGQETIHHFTADNSPLLSNTVFDIEIFGETGEVFFATDKGLMSYIGDATDGDEYTGPTYAYPNPVPPDYDGVIGIKGLVPNAEVKITDITGNVIYETISEGTTATWDGNSLNGNRAQTGVYIVFSVSDDGTQKEVTKILFIN